jgi:hypothetical protein
MSSADACKNERNKKEKESDFSAFFKAIAIFVFVVHFILLPFISLKYSFQRATHSERTIV